MQRRKFIKQTLTATALTAFGRMPLSAMNPENELLRLTILHTNDQHSRIDPFPMDGSRYQGLGGFAKRATLIKKIRQEADHVLLLDAGDIFQGTPYFNFFHGEVEIAAMSKMGYDAATIGNHDFDGGIDNLAKQVSKADFEMIISNYHLEDTPMANHFKPYKIFRKGSLKIGVIGVGIEVKGLVPKKLYGNTVYQDPVAKANHYATLLKHEMGCDYVILLSHLGYKYRTERLISDKRLAPLTRNIDLIIGGHTHTFMEGPDLMTNAEGKPIRIHQVGWAGIILGRLDVDFTPEKTICGVRVNNTFVS